MTLENLSQRAANFKTSFNLVHKKERLAELEKLASDPNLWQDQAKAIEVTSNLADLKKDLDDLELIDLLISQPNLPAKDQANLEETVNRLELKSFLADSHDQESAILSIHAGTGGVDAMDWAEMLMRMYLRFCGQGRDTPQRDFTTTLGIDRSGWQTAIIDLSRGEEAGIKSATITVSGLYAYGLLKKEAGVHRLVRLSPFNAKNLRQTSFALVEVLPLIKSAALELIIPEKDLRIDVFRSSGHGGQSVNTTDSAVRLTHLPTNLTVSVQNERSQHQNKALALRILQSKLKLMLELEKRERLDELRGEVKTAVWGSQIRSYVLQPYQLVKDHRTEYETSEVEKVLNGEIDGFIESEIRNLK